MFSRANINHQDWDTTRLIPQTWLLLLPFFLTVTIGWPQNRCEARLTWMSERVRSWEQSQTREGRSHTKAAARCPLWKPISSLSSLQRNGPDLLFHNDPYIESICYLFAEPDRGWTMRENNVWMLPWLIWQRRPAIAVHTLTSRAL